MIPYGSQDVCDEDIEAVVQTLRSDWLTQGPAVENFERAVGGYCGSDHAVAMNSATSALHLACKALALGPGDSMWTSPNTFVASANAALHCGATVDFVDIDERTYNMSVAALASKLEKAKGAGTLPKVVMPVHCTGQSCDMKEIGDLAKEYGFAVVEDASHAIGGRYLGGRIGNCAYSAITVFSFHPVKIVTTGEGGMAVTNNPELAERLRLLRSHGITRDTKRMVGQSHGPWYYEQIDLGFNFRMTDIQAALGTSQMKRIDGFLRARHAIAERYNQALRELPLILPWQNPSAQSAYHLYPIQIDPAKTAKTREQIFGELRNGGIGVNVHYIPVHTQPYYRAQAPLGRTLPVAERYYARTISLPLFPALDEERQQRVINVLTKAFH
ncbi:MAG TPA: UDP-4-amino-4,6-dideoxy-N-acetyl-beta-L-altrosamine transaminase [Burkholderiales bacterium]